MLARIHRVELASWARDERSVRRLLRALGYAPTGARPRVLVASFRSSRPASQSASSDRWIRAKSAQPSCWFRSSLGEYHQAPMRSPIGAWLIAGLVLTGCQSASPPPAPAVQVDPVATFAAHLVALESRLRSPRTPFVQFGALGQNEQDAYYQLMAHPDWLPRVLQAAPPDLRPVIQANVNAELELRELNGTARTLPHWRIDKPQSPPDLLAHYREAERAYGIPWSYFAAINFVESRMGRIHGLSSAGAVGPMQFLPSTWAYY